jgi:uncharacterized membrane protein YbhN (UPF0104 family)
MKTALRWAVAAVILWLLFRRVPIDEALAAARRADLWAFVPAVLASVLLRFWIDALTLRYLVTRFHVPLSGREARSACALVHFVSVINWGLGAAAFLRHLQRAKGVHPMDSASTVFLTGATDALVKVAVGTLGLLFLLADASLRPLAVLAVLVLVGQFATGWLIVADRPTWDWLRRAREMRVWRTPRRVAGRDLAFVVPLRALRVVGFVVILGFAMRAFSIPVPPVYLLASMPVVMLVATIPITPAGLGTQQAAMLYFYRSFGTEADVLAFGLLMPLALTLGQVALGALYTRDLTVARESDESSSSQPTAISNES